jgi:hypothetical protein
MHPARGATTLAMLAHHAVIAEINYAHFASLRLRCDNRNRQPLLLFSASVELVESNAWWARDTW